jgi:hypothetical protein
MNKPSPLKKGCLVRIQNMRQFASSEYGRKLSAEELNVLIKLDGASGVVQSLEQDGIYLVLCGKNLIRARTAHLVPLCAQSNTDSSHVLKSGDYCFHSQDVQETN